METNSRMDFAQMLIPLEERHRNAPPMQSVEARMAHYHVPGLGVAVIDGGRLTTRTYGVREAFRAAPVTLTTRFQAGSISKPIAVVAALRLVEQGVLNLDADVNDVLTAWKVPSNNGWSPRVTLRQLMSHSAGVTVHGFPGYGRGGPVPTLVEVLQGREPANTPPIRVDIIPGMQFRYSGGGTTVMQQLLIDACGAPFPEIARALVLAPIGMAESTYEQPHDPPSWEITHGHRSDGSRIAGGWRLCPEMAAAGLWTTPSDLARFVLAIQACAVGAPDALLSPAMTAQMLSPQVAEEAGTGRFIGLGLYVSGAGATMRFGHDGAHIGFKASMVGYQGAPRGAIVMTNGDEGRFLAHELLWAIASAYGWPDYHAQTPFPPVPPDRLIASYLGTYRTAAGTTITVTEEAGTLVLWLTGQSPIVVIPQGQVFVAAPTMGLQVSVRFVPEPSGTVERLLIQQDGRDVAAARMR